MQNQIFTSIPANELQELISAAVRNELALLKPQVSETPNEFLTCRQTAAKLQISLPTLYKWSRESKLKGYRIAGQIRYKSNEVESALKAMLTIKDFK